MRWKSNIRLKRSLVYFAFVQKPGPASELGAADVSQILF